MGTVTEADIVDWIAKDAWMLDILYTASTLKLPDWWICAGLVRSKLWDYLDHKTVRTPVPDIDVIYYDTTNIQEETEKEYESHLKELRPDLPWSFKNQARMHIVNRFPAYTSSLDAISKFPETATCLGIKLDQRKKVILAAPHGISDLIDFAIKPTPFFEASFERMSIYDTRVKNKQWNLLWPKLKIYSS
ncbi:hypothetical protein J2Z69_000796 [Paenibacillus shirakamiensis]|uniref:Nucleotidyltransferase family protein n=1 Tax=Paenibacillus shirakamiensis TaxID=1265935 RepID=A0ABS4JDI4_9BACL|nr:nucleotidyltransferase family protein [Paenibacillus shirakamiensis]MBP1999777.1 hypothetical protein [Paenibacillus shirakamiensis]